MTTFVLVHGCFRGGWAWKRVALHLQAAGHLVHYPTLDGCGDRKGAMRTGITLDTHGAEIANLLFYEDLSDVVLVGTSTGGMVTARAAELVRDRIDRLVFMSALVPFPGESVYDILVGRERSDPNLAYFGPDPAELDRPGSRGSFMDLDPADRAWARARYTQHPIAAAEGTVDLRSFWSQPWKADVLWCKRATTPPAAHQRRAAERLSARFSELDADHNAALSHPREVAEFLMSLN